MLGSDLRTHVADWKSEVVTAAGSIGHDVREVRFSDVAILDNVHEAVAGLDTAVFAGDGIAGHVSAANRYNEDTVENIYDQVVPIHVKGSSQFDRVRQLSRQVSCWHSSSLCDDTHVAGLVGLSHVYESWIHLLQ